MYEEASQQYAGEISLGRPWSSISGGVHTIGSGRRTLKAFLLKHYVLIGCLGVLGSCYLVYFKRDAFS